VSRVYKQQRNQARQADFLALFDLLMDRANFDALDDMEVQRQLNRTQTRGGISVRVNQVLERTVTLFLCDNITMCVLIWERWGGGMGGKEGGRELNRIDVTRRPVRHTCHMFEIARSCARVEY